MRIEVLGESAYSNMKYAVPHLETIYPGQNIGQRYMEQVDAQMQGLTGDRTISRGSNVESIRGQSIGTAQDSGRGL